ncbi:NlpC/P60 family protein [Actinomycetospora atypica]|uniref:NlpC/P60 family protein n=1 Tax=Actinomycetospora atypica TaxID=1290095 RepID=A0ABV9YIR8_9PSEU
MIRHSQQFLRESWDRRGFDQHHDGALVVEEGLRFLGREYGISRHVSERMDCSTLTSQALWEGAGLLIPFLAENQRTSGLGRVVPVDALIPGDLVFKYAGVTATRPHNHVALMGGWTVDDEPLLIESTEQTGVSMSTLGCFGPVVSARRFVIDRPETRNAEFERRHLGWRELAIATPKLARYGARLTAGGGRHEGFDIHLNSAVEVLAPIRGTVTSVSRGRGACDLSITSASGSTIVEIGPVDLNDAPTVGDLVRPGAVLGVSAGHHTTRVGCNTFRTGQKHLHINVQSSELPYQQTLWPLKRPGDYGPDPINVLYAIRTGAIAPPIATGSIVWSPSQ